MRRSKAAYLLVVLGFLVGWMTPDYSWAASKPTGSAPAKPAGKPGGGSVNKSNVNRGNVNKGGTAGRPGAAATPRNTPGSRGKGNTPGVQNQPRGRAGNPDNVRGRGNAEARGRGNVGPRGRTGNVPRGGERGHARGGTRHGNYTRRGTYRHGSHHYGWRGYHGRYWYYGGWAYGSAFAYDAFWADYPGFVVGVPFFWAAENVWILPGNDGYYSYGDSEQGPWTEREPVPEDDYQEVADVPAGGGGPGGKK